jgi:hypothetical protein
LPDGKNKAQHRIENGDKPDAGEDDHGYSYPDHDVTSRLFSSARSRRNWTCPQTMVDMSPQAPAEINPIAIGHRVGAGGGIPTAKAAAIPVAPMMINGASAMLMPPLGVFFYSWIIPFMLSYLQAVLPKGVTRSGYCNL